MRRAYLALAVLIVLAVLVTACNRSAPTTPKAAGTGAANSTTTARTGTPRAAPSPVTAGGTAVPAAPAAPAAQATAANPPAAIATTAPLAGGPATAPAAAGTNAPAPAGGTPAAAAGGSNCTDRASMIQDVTVPDNTAIPPAQSFVKTWRIRNTGTCTWDTGYALIFAKGEQLGGQASVQFPSSVAPGASVDMSVNLTAPAAAGTYKGNWQLRNSRGQAFGIPTPDNTFWVQIVVGPASRVTFPAGGTTATLNATLVNGVPRGYGLQAQAGQKVTVKANSGSNATLAATDAKGSPVNITASGDKQWDITIPAAGDYILNWRGSGPITFTVSAPPAK